MVRFEIAPRLRFYAACAAGLCMACGNGQNGESLPDSSSQARVSGIFAGASVRADVPVRETRPSRGELCEAYQSNLRDIMSPDAVASLCSWWAYFGAKLRDLSEEEAVDSCEESATACRSREESDSFYSTCPAGIVTGSTCTATVQVVADCLEARWNWRAQTLEGISGCEDWQLVEGDAGDALHDEYLELEECAAIELSSSDCFLALASEQWPIEAQPFPD